MSNNNNKILDKVVSLKEEIENYVYGKGVTVPSDVIKSIQDDKRTHKLLERITHSASASVGLDIHETLSDHYSGGYSLWGNYHIWTKESKEKVKAALLEKVNNVKVTSKHNELFFFEDEKPSGETRDAVVKQHKQIATSAIHYTFAEDESYKVGLQATALQAILALIDIPGAKPSADPIIVRNMISISRFQDITKREKNPNASINALKKVAREWYQSSERNHLYHKTGYNNYDFVIYYLYILKAEQLEQVRSEFLEDIERNYKDLKAETWNSDAVFSAQFLLEKVQKIMSWQVEN